MGRESRQARRAKERRQQHRGRRAASSSNKWSMYAGGGVIVVVALVLAGFAFTQHTTSAGALATATASAELTPVPGLTVAGIPCTYNEVLGAYHIHAHLGIFYQGKAYHLPPNIGIIPDYDCLYWVHVHNPSHDILHVEAPASLVPTLGQFFAIWHQPLTASRVAQFTVQPGEKIKVFVNQKPYTGNPASIKLRLHTDITVEIGPPFLSPQKFDFAKYGV